MIPAASNTLAPAITGGNESFQEIENEGSPAAATAAIQHKAKRMEAAISRASARALARIWRGDLSKRSFIRPVRHPDQSKKSQRLKKTRGVGFQPMIPADDSFQPFPGPPRPSPLDFPESLP